MVVEAVKRDLETLGLTDTSLGATAIALADRLDDYETSAAAAAACAKELRSTMAELNQMANAKPTATDGVSEIEQRRARRLRKTG